jgi:hypothetical protein
MMNDAPFPGLARSMLARDWWPLASKQFQAVSLGRFSAYAVTRPM